MRTKPEMSGVSVVLLGSFNPAIFTPAWFVMHDLLPKSVADNAELQVAHRHLCVFSTEWLQFEVTPDRFQAGTQQAPVVRIRDLVLRVFREHLFHTPVGAFGINRDVHFRATSRAAMNQLGRVLAPVEPWKAIGNEFDPTRSDSGLASLTMRQSKVEDRPTGGQINVKVEPSNRIGNGQTGVYVQVNDHYQIDESRADGREKLLRLLEDGFDQSIQRADSIVDHLMSLATGP